MHRDTGESRGPNHSHRPCVTRHHERSSLSRQRHVNVTSTSFVLASVVPSPFVFAPFGFYAAGHVAGHRGHVAGHRGHVAGHRGHVAGHRGRWPVARFRTAFAARRRLDRSLARRVRRRRRRSVLFFLLDPPVLEPDFHLLLGQPQTVGDLYAPQTGQVHVGSELAFQFQQLVTGESRSDPLGTAGVCVALALSPERISCAL